MFTVERAEILKIAIDLLKKKKKVNTGALDKVKSFLSRLLNATEMKYKIFVECVCIASIHSGAPHTNIK